MPKLSAGILLYRRTASGLEVLLVHPGGPFWARKDAGAWSIPKGEHESSDDPLGVAVREFAEETGYELDLAGAPSLVELGSVRQRSGKIVSAWALEGEVDPARVRSNTFELEWPPRSGRMEEFPEIDRAEWFDPGTARTKINPAQAAFIDRLVEQVLGEAGSAARQRDDADPQESLF